MLRTAGNKKVDTSESMSQGIQLSQLEQPRCSHCRGLLPEGRTRFCSDFCLATFKRLQERILYGHRHKYRCVECGHELHLGRHRKDP